MADHSGQLKQIKAPACPSCGYDGLDGYTGITGKGPPTPGDFSICLYCGELLAFSLGRFGLTLRGATDAERENIERRHPTLLRKAEAARRHVGRTHPKIKPRRERF